MVKKGSHRLRIGRISEADFVYFVSTHIKEGSTRIDEKMQHIIDESIKLCESSGGFYLHCYTIMPDHLHLLFRVGRTKSLSQTMQSMRKWTTRSFNKLDNSQKFIWQSGFFDHRIRSEQDFYDTVQYIFLNPVAGGLTGYGWDWPG